ncbi:MAG: metallophosphoesterase [Phocaeicola sp.]|nr:metallophosphoesterase [Phocaeicola sp.]MBR1720704.1 metallophosphoesterase [Phocaeicola sp.]
MKHVTTFFIFAAMLIGLSFNVQAENIKILHGPYLQNVGETEATFVWEVNNPSIGWVELAPDDGSHFYATPRTKYFNTKSGVKMTSQLHAVKITGLQPGTTYRYRVYAQEVLSHEGWRVHYGDIAATNVYSQKPLTFTTRDTKKSTTSFIILNDVHARKDVITPLLNFAKYKEREMVFFNGDMVSQFTDEQTIFDGFMDESIQVFAKEKPLYYVRGNHETRGPFATHFQDYFNPRENHIYGTLQDGPIFFILLDTGEDKPDSDLEYAGITDYDNYRTEQVEWLKQVIASEAFKQAKFKVVIGHIPPVPEKGAWHGTREVMEKFVPILNKGGVDIMICGHLHQHVYVEPSEKVHFPVLVNSNNACVLAETKGNELNVKVIGLDGKVTFDKNYPAK